MRQLHHVRAAEVKLGDTYLEPAGRFRPVVGVGVLVTDDAWRVVLQLGGSMRGQEPGPVMELEAEQIVEVVR